MARRNTGPAYNPPSPEPEDRIAMEGDIVCCLGECRQVVELATSVLSQQFATYLNQIAVILARVLEPIRAMVLSQLQIAQDKTDTITIQLEDAALHHLMLTAAMIQSLQAGLPAAAGSLAGAAVPFPPTTAAASVGVGGGSLSGAQAAGTLATLPVGLPVAPDKAPARSAQIGPAPLPLLAPGQLPPAPPGLYPPFPLPYPVTSATPEPPGQLVPVVPGEPIVGECPDLVQRPWPVDLPQLLPFLFSGDTDQWRGRALSWLGSEFAEKLSRGSFAAFAEPVDYFAGYGPGKYVAEQTEEVPDYAKEARTGDLDASD